VVFGNDSVAAKHAKTSLADNHSEIEQGIRPYKTGLIDHESAL
jgi:hypothetical protein